MYNYIRSVTDLQYSIVKWNLLLQQNQLIMNVALCQHKAVGSVRNGLNGKLATVTPKIYHRTSLWNYLQPDNGQVLLQTEVPQLGKSCELIGSSQATSSTVQRVGVNVIEQFQPLRLRYPATVAVRSEVHNLYRRLYHTTQDIEMSNKTVQYKCIDATGCDLAGCRILLIPKQLVGVSLSDTCDISVTSRGLTEVIPKSTEGK